MRARASGESQFSPCDAAHVVAVRHPIRLAVLSSEAGELDAAFLIGARTQCAERFLARRLSTSVTIASSVPDSKSLLAGNPPDQTMSRTAGQG
jgi:hypothetical protein